MKKLFISALLSITVALTSFAASENKASFAARNTFASQFKHVSNVEWTSTEHYIKATFIMDDIRTDALYSVEGDFIGTEQAVTLDHLPLKAKRAFAKKFAGYTVEEAVRFEGPQESAYFISAANEKGSVILKVEDSGSISTVKR